MFSIFKKKEERAETTVKELTAYISGQVIPIEEVEDEVFSSKALGGGLAIEPQGDTVTAPCDGIISVVMTDTGHAVGMTLDNGAELLIHEGLDTVNMAGEGFKLYVKEGQRVKKGEKLLSFDPDKIREKGLKTTCVLVLTNDSEFPGVKYMTGIEAKQGETVIARF